MMIWTAYTAAKAFAAKVPWYVWAALGILIVAWLWGNSRYDAGVDDTEAKYAEIARKAVVKARQADETANTQRATDNERIENAARKREDAARTGGRTGANCERLRAAYPNRAIPACD